MVPLSWFMKKNWNLNLGKKSSFCIENGTFCLKLSVIKLKSSIFSTKWTFFPQIQISIFLHKSTQWDHRRLLHKFQEETFFLLVSGFVYICQQLLNIWVLWDFFLSTVDHCIETIFAALIFFEYLTTSKLLT